MYHVLLFIFILNLAFRVTQDMDIYNLGYSPIIDYMNPTYLLGLLIVNAFATIVGTTIVIKLVNPFNRSASDLTVAAIIFFSTTFWELYYDTYNQLLTLTSNYASIHWWSFGIINILTLVVIIVFAAGVHQMITGGWKSYE